MAINKISETTRRLIREKSVLSLPDRPSEKGYTADQLKEYFTNLVLGDQGALTEIDRIADEINELVGDISDTTIKNYVLDSIVSKLVEQSPYIGLSIVDNKLKYTKFGSPNITGELDYIPEDSVFFNGEYLIGKSKENILPKTSIDKLIDTIDDKTVREYILYLNSRINELLEKHNSEISSINSNIEEILGGDAPDALNSIKELAEALKNNPSQVDNILLQLSNLNSGKVDKVEGKQLSTNDYDNVSKSFVDSLKSKNLVEVENLKTDLKQFNDDFEHRLVTDAEKATWNSKANSIHLHEINDVSGLQDVLNSKSSSDHTHTADDIGAEKIGVAANLIDSHNKNATAHEDIRKTLSELTNKIDGINSAISFENEQELSNWLNGSFVRSDGLTSNDLFIGQHIYIKDQDENDYWVSTKPVNSISDLTQLPTDKINLEDYAEIDDLKRVAFTGSYKDLIDVPNIPNALSELTEDENHKTITQEKLNLIDTNASNILSKLDKNLGKDQADKILVTDADGNISTAVSGSMALLIDNLESNSTTMAPTANQVRILNNIKLDKQQGAENAGKYLQIDSLGLVNLVNLEIPKTIIELEAGTINASDLEDGMYKLQPSSSYKWKGTSGICRVSCESLLLLTTRSNGTRDSILLSGNAVNVGNSADSGSSMKSLMSTDNLVTYFYPDFQMIFNTGSMREDWQNRTFYACGREIWFKRRNNNNDYRFTTNRYDLLYIGNLNENGELDFVLFQQDGVIVGYGADRDDVPTPKKILYKDIATLSDVEQQISSIPTPDVSGQINNHNSDVAAHQDIRDSIPVVTNDLTNDLKNNYDAAYIHSQSAHAPTTVATTSSNGLMSSIDKSNVDANTTARHTHSNKTALDAVTIDWMNSLASQTFVTEKINQIPTPDVSGQISTHNADSSAHQDIRNLIDTKIASLINGAPTTLDTLKEIADAMSANETVVDALEASIGSKANTSDLASYVPTSRTVNGKALSANISLGNKDVGALPDYTLTINHGTAGNPRMVKFASVNYTSAATCFKMGAMTCHDNGVSYQFLTDMLIAVTTAGDVNANIYKFAQSSVGNVDGVARYTGDVFYVNDTTNKIVDFYILCGQYSSSQFTPVTKVGSTTIDYVTQYSGGATYYSSGEKVWVNGCGTTYARLSDITNNALALDGSNTMTGKLNLKATGANEGNIGTNGIRWNLDSLPQDTAPQYVCTIDGFANGGRQKWATVIDLKAQMQIHKLGTTNWKVTQDSSGNLVFTYE